MITPCLACSSLVRVPTDYRRYKVRCPECRSFFRMDHHSAPVPLPAQLPAQRAGGADEELHVSDEQLLDVIIRNSY